MADLDITEIRRGIAADRKNALGDHQGVYWCNDAAQIGKTVEDLFLENVYNSTYELVRDL